MFGFYLRQAYIKAGSAVARTEDGSINGENQSIGSSSLAAIKEPLGLGIVGSEVELGNISTATIPDCSLCMFTYLLEHDLTLSLESMNFLNG